MVLGDPEERSLEMVKKVEAGKRRVVHFYDGTEPTVASRCGALADFTISWRWVTCKSCLKLRKAKGR